MYQLLKKKKIKLIVLDVEIYYRVDEPLSLVYIKNFYLALTGTGFKQNYLVCCRLLNQSHK